MKTEKSMTLPRIWRYIGRCLMKWKYKIQYDCKAISYCTTCQNSNREFKKV